jgi:hypothetical protein
MVINHAHTVKSHNRRGSPLFYTMSDSDYIRVMCTSNVGTGSTPTAFENTLARPLSYGPDSKVQVALESLTYTIKPIPAQEPDVDNHHARTIYVNTDAITSSERIGDQFSNAIARITLKPQQLIGFNVRQPAGQPNGEQTFYNPIYSYQYTYEAPSLKFIDAVGGEVASIATLITSTDSIDGLPASSLIEGVTVVTYVFRNLQ